MKKIIVSFILLLWSIAAVSAQVSLSIDGESSDDIVRRKNYALLALSKPFFKQNISSVSIQIASEQSEPRWQFKWERITMAGDIKDDGEFMKVLAHELGHYVDIITYTKTQTTPDISAKFYAISWKSSNEKYRESKLSDFVSGYAITNQYEDFAESFVFYMFHNATFKEKAKKSEILQKKYDFLRTYIFKKWEFVNKEYAIEPKTIDGYLWDTTKVRIFLKKYLFSFQ